MDTVVQPVSAYRRGVLKGKARNVYFYPAHIDLVKEHAERLGLEGEAAFSSALRSILDQWAAVVEPNLVDRRAST